MNIIGLMRELRDLLNDFADNLTSYSNKWRSQTNQQQLISSYHTTKNAQIQTVEAPKKDAEHIKDICNAIQRVIDEYKRQVNEMYPRLHFSIAHKHCRSEEMKRLFKTARSSLQNTLDELDELSKKHKYARDALSTAEKEHEKLSHDSTTSQNKLTQAHEKIIQRIQELQLIENNICSTEATRNVREKSYRKEATEIFKQCQELEKQRLDQIKQTLIKFNEAVSASDYSCKLGMIYQQLISGITTQQNSIDDLNHWAQTYGITKTDLSTTNDTAINSVS